MLIGSNNAVLGNKNIIIGKRNAVMGNNNYIFSQNFSNRNAKDGGAMEAISDTLVADNWVGELDKREIIMEQLHSVVYPVE